MPINLKWSCYWTEIADAVDCAMARKKSKLTMASDAGDQNLDQLNARATPGRTASAQIRRSMEAQIEAKAKRRRKGEAAASAAWQKAR